MYLRFNLYNIDYCDVFHIYRYHHLIKRFPIQIFNENFIETLINKTNMMSHFYSSSLCFTLKLFKKCLIEIKFYKFVIFLWFKNFRNNLLKISYNRLSQWIKSWNWYQFKKAIAVLPNFLVIMDLRTQSWPIVNHEKWTTTLTSAKHRKPFTTQV